MLDDHCLNNNKVEYIYFTPTEMKKQWFNFNHKIEINYINRILKSSIKLEKNDKVERQKQFETNGGLEPKVSGRFYRYKNKYYEKE